jgi:hypothetical protein
MPRPKPNDGLTNAARYYKLHKEVCKARTKRWQKKHPEWYGKEYRKRRKRRIEPLWKIQKGKCAICSRKLEHPYEDHNHSCCPITKRSGCLKCRRGLLCPSCNGGLHMFENKRLFKAAIAYLKKWETQCKIQKNTSSVSSPM